jgi:hypothetical protein
MFLSLLLAAVMTAAPVGGLDYTSRHHVTVTGRWSAGPCPGTVGPVRCLFRGDTLAGPVFLDTSPKHDIRLLRGARTPAEIRQAFREIARRLFAEFRADRQQFCPGYAADRSRVVVRTVAGRSGVRWSETLRAPDGSVDEKYVHYAMVRRGFEYLLWIEAVARDACYRRSSATGCRPGSGPPARCSTSPSPGRSYPPLLPERTGVAPCAPAADRGLGSQA